MEQTSNQEKTDNLIEVTGIEQPTRTRLIDAASTKLASMKDAVDVLGKLLLASVAITYCTGFVITNLDLSRFQLISFSLTRPQYLIVGVLWAVYSAIAFLPFMLYTFS